MMIVVLFRSEFAVGHIELDYCLKHTDIGLFVIFTYSCCIKNQLNYKKFTKVHMICLMSDISRRRERTLSHFNCMSAIIKRC